MVWVGQNRLGDGGASPDLLGQTSTGGVSSNNSNNSNILSKVAVLRGIATAVIGRLGLLVRVLGWTLGPSWAFPSNSDSPLFEPGVNINP